MKRGLCVLARLPRRLYVLYIYVHKCTVLYTFTPMGEGEIFSFFYSLILSPHTPLGLNIIPHRKHTASGRQANRPMQGGGPEPEFVNLLRSPGIESQPMVAPVRQPSPARLYKRGESIPRNRSLDSWNVYKSGLRVVGRRCGGGAGGDGECFQRPNPGTMAKRWL